MALDVSTITAAITEGQVASIAVCLAAGVAIWAIRSVKLLRDGGEAAPGHWYIYAECPHCGTNIDDNPDAFDLDHSDSCPECGGDLDMYYRGDGDGESYEGEGDILDGHPCPNCGCEEWNDLEEEDCYVCVSCGHEEYDAETAYERSRELG